MSQAAIEVQGIGKKFSIFPGSALFKRGPEWVMAAELVETTKLYARTVGPARNAPLLRPPGIRCSKRAT